MTSRSLEDCHPECARRARAVRAAMKELGHPIFVYCTFRSLEEQRRKVEEGSSWTRRGWHNLLDPDSGARASQAVDVAFTAQHPWAKEHPWHVLRNVAEGVGLLLPALSRGDLGHLVWKGGRSFKDTWDAQAHHHKEAA